MSGMSEIKLPELCRAELLKLYAQAQRAKQLYDVASNAALTALGLDPRDANELNLDTGVVKHAKPEGS